MYKNYGKRYIDLLFATFLSITLFPLFFILAFLIKIKLGKPVIFKQERPGKDGRIFKMYKFRTMTNDCDLNGILLPDDVRLTNFGKLLRSTSLDELPELFNIFKGDMSFVGPRPQLIKDMVFFNKEEMKRQSVLPGLTGLAQINGRNNISWERKFYYDLKYIQNISLFNDIKIMLLTIHKVLKKEDINSDGMVTAEDLGDYLLRTGKVSKKEYESKLSNVESVKIKNGR
jgi:undecaprenyl phosphate N,N'-diacetylbacillosamine 1-phosphate transferase